MTGDGKSKDARLFKQALNLEPVLQRRRYTHAIGGVARRCLGSWRAILLTVLVISSVGWCADLFYVDYRLDRQTDNAAARDVVKAASDGVVALLSYSPDSLGRDIDMAKSRVTPGFQTSFKRFTEQVVAPAAQRGQLTTSVRVIRAAVSELHPDSAAVLMFISQKTTSKEKPEPLNTTSDVLVDLTKAEGAWLINKIDSV